MTNTLSEEQIAATPFCWVYTLDCTDGIPENTPMYRFLFDAESKPFGEPGKNYSEEYPVTVQPLYASPSPRIAELEAAAGALVQNADRVHPHGDHYVISKTDMDRLVSALKPTGATNGGET